MTESTSNQLCKLPLLTFELDNCPIKIIKLNISKTKYDFTLILTGCHITMALTTCIRLHIHAVSCR